MDGANADSDHSMTWEDFFGSTTDLTPTLIGIYDSLLEPSKSVRPEVNRFETAKDARNDPPVLKQVKALNVKGANTAVSQGNQLQKDSVKMSVKLPAGTINKSSLYSMRTKGDKNGASDNEMISNDVKSLKNDSKFDNLSPNVRRMISGATETTTIKLGKKSTTVGRSSMRHRSNIPLVGATSKISQSGVDLLQTVEIYDQPCSMKSFAKKAESNSPSKTEPIKPDFKLNDGQITYDVPTNNRPAIYALPNTKTAFESLSLPYIDQSIECSVSSNDREFDTKLSSKENSPGKQSPDVPSPPAKIPKTVNAGPNSLHRNEYSPKLLPKSGLYPEVIGSTGNLKSSIPEKEVLRLNPPVVEVSRPLSLSSIASSSSTSSSGVQNKGGVNSAYLASIESLDDHSDADLTSANGSNNFVNNAGVMNNNVTDGRIDIPRQQTFDETPGLSQLERVCAEIVQTENVYVEHLRQVVEGYLHVWRKESTFSEEELSELFNNIEDIYTFNRSLCEDLNTCRFDATCIAQCFVNNTTGFSVYTSYCTGYPRTMERLAALASSAESAREFRDRQLALHHPLPLASYLLKPVQRILKYHLLLQKVVKLCATTETEYALLKMTSIAQHIDDMKRKHEHAVRVQEIQSLLYGWNGPDLTTYGELCAEGTFRVFGAKAMRHAFLFDKMLLVTKNREDGILAYKTHIMCNNMMLIESIAGAPLSFHVIPWDSPRSQLTLMARSPQHKREWTLLLKRVILENFNAVIPSHVRQLVMELGQNKTDDDMIAEKSHGLITQASMRKQLSAPEYLEKRKLERERKTFENGIRGRLKKVNRKYTVPNSRTETSQECDCAQVSAEKGTDFTCENCYVDLCSDCETETKRKDKKEDGVCNKDEVDVTADKNTECDKSLLYVEAGSEERLERKSCKCTDFKSSQESFNKEFGSSLNKTRSYHSSDNIVGYAENDRSKEDLTESNSSISNVKNMQKTCLKCSKIKENIAVTESSGSLHARKSRCNDSEKHKADTLRSKSKDDPQRSRLSKISTWRRKSEPGLQNNPGIIIKKSQDDYDRSLSRGNEKIEFECRICGSNKITRRKDNAQIVSDPELDSSKTGINNKPSLEIKMYNTKNVPKKISKLKKNRAKRSGTDTTAKFYADFSTDVSTENILHISESNDSLNTDKPKENSENVRVPENLVKDEDIDEETYKKLIEKTDSFKKNELEKVKFLNKQKVIKEGSEVDEKIPVEPKTDDVQESCEESEQPLEQIISQLLMQNREFQKLLKKQQQRNSAQRRHQRLLKSHSNPEPVIIARSCESIKLKPKFCRQFSENVEHDDQPNLELSAPIASEDISDDDHIYETLRVENKLEDHLRNLNIKSKVIQHSKVVRPKRLASPPNPILNKVRSSTAESDYVYLSFDKLNQIQDATGIYEVPIKSPEKKVQDKTNDYYVAMGHHKPVVPNNEENIYDNLVEVCQRKKDLPNSDYLPMGDQQSPNTPEIWLSRQKEHFNVSRDRKSGSLPRSFQVVTNTTNEEDSLSTFKCKPNSNSKTYLNRDGKVMSIDRPYTIASDNGDMCYDDVENYMSENEMLKFNKTSNKDKEFTQNISQSTLELEQEIDRCYKNNFEKMNLDTNKNENLTISQPNLNTSTSSCEVLSPENGVKKDKDITVVHPEHKIYKPTSNMLSLKNVLNRFKTKTPNKSNEESEINSNENSSPDSLKTELKSPTVEKKSALNPRSYSKNLLQRFRSIIGDEHNDDNHNYSNKKNEDDSLNNKSKGDLTSIDSSPSTSIADQLSKSVFEDISLKENEDEKRNQEHLSQSCDDLIHKPGTNRPNYEKSISLITNVASTNTSPVKTNNNSYQNLNKLPIYMQGSKHLGARIAQSDYLDPMTLNHKSVSRSVNVLINKNAVRPDSLFSNSSFITTSSDGVYQENKRSQTVVDGKEADKQNLTDSIANINTDDSFYERKFEKIEQITDDDVFRDSAVYSDQEESEDIKIDSKKVMNKSVTRVESIKRGSSFKSEKVTVTSRVNEKTMHTKITVTTNKTERCSTGTEIKSIEKVKTKSAPPVPIKPKLTNIPTAANFQNRNISINKGNLQKSQEQETTSETSNSKTVKRNTSLKQNFLKTESLFEKCAEQKSANELIKTEDIKPENNSKLKPPGNIQLKRLGFERASLDSATRKIKPHENKRSSIEPPKTKSVLERRMEIELMAKSDKPAVALKKPVPKPKQITTKLASFERSLSESPKEKDLKHSISQECHSNNENVENVMENSDSEIKASWVKQVVNKFQ